jgi:hypothetical protein
MCRQEKEGYGTRRQAKAEPEGEAPAQWPTRGTAADYTPEVGPEYREGHSRSIATSRLLHISKESESHHAELTVATMRKQAIENVASSCFHQANVAKQPGSELIKRSLSVNYYEP